ncbi:bleomycin resistance protein [Dactylosporangium sp. CA-233914]|uniref:bleomycin resistance protein n=1 Tax=Dactylosporangium sp. CA-233914 TaxID=3239934 RepID=UPI003D8AF3B9
MANERTVPLLPCASIDEMLEFYGALGFEVTYRQSRPNPYAALRREDLHLHFFAMPGFVPADSYGSCLVLVPDIEALHRAFAEGLRARYGRVPVAGIPRMTRPRARKNAGGVTGFSVVDPGGNWIRVTAIDGGRPPATSAEGKLAVTLENAVVLADSRGDQAQAARILDSALAREDATADVPVLREALAYRAELAESLGDSATAEAVRTRLESLG